MASHELPELLQKRIRYEKNIEKLEEAMKKINNRIFKMHTCVYEMNRLIMEQCHHIWVYTPDVDVCSKCGLSNPIF